MGYAIGGNGLEETKHANIEMGKVYWLGASSSPALVLVTDITEGYKGRGMVHYIKVHTAETEDAPKIMRSESWIFEDLVVRAETTICKDAHNISNHYRNDNSHMGQIMVKAANSKLVYVGGMDYIFMPWRICNCCGTEMETETTCPDCGCSNDYRENHSAATLIH